MAYTFNVERFFRILTKATEVYAAYVASKPKEAPATVVPFPVPVAAEPVPPPVVEDDAQVMRRVQAHYKDILSRTRSDITNAEMDEAVDLIRAGREADLVEQLNRRK
jgi:hypothetical protein